MKKLEGQLSGRRVRAFVPTGSLKEFVEVYLSHAFTVDDIDRTNFDQMTRLARFVAHLVTLTPEHQAYLNANPWARQCASESEETISALFGREPSPR